jgi:hypothetical protein
MAARMGQNSLQRQVALAGMECSGGNEKSIKDIN